MTCPRPGLVNGFRLQSLSIPATKLIHSPVGGESRPCGLVEGLCQAWQAGMGCPCPCISYSPHNFVLKLCFRHVGCHQEPATAPPLFGGGFPISGGWCMAGGQGGGREGDHLSTFLGSEQAVKCRCMKTHGPSPGPTRSSSGPLRARGPAQRASKIRNALAKTKHSLAQDEASGRAVAMQVAPRTLEVGPFGERVALGPLLPFSNLLTARGVPGGPAHSSDTWHCPVLSRGQRRCGQTLVGEE